MAEETAEMDVTDVTAREMVTGHTDLRLHLLEVTGTVMTDTGIVHLLTRVVEGTIAVLVRPILTMDSLFPSVRHKTFRMCRSSPMKISIATLSIGSKRRSRAEDSLSMYSISARAWTLMLSFAGNWSRAFSLCAASAVPTKIPGLSICVSSIVQALVPTTLNLTTTITRTSKFVSSSFHARNRACGVINRLSNHPNNSTLMASHHQQHMACLQSLRLDTLQVSLRHLLSHQLEAPH